MTPFVWVNRRLKWKLVWKWEDVCWRRWIYKSIWNHKVNFLVAWWYWWWWWGVSVCSKKYEAEDLRICVLRVQGVYVEPFIQHIHCSYLLHVCDSWMQVHGSITWKWNLFCIQYKVNLGKFRWRIVWEHKEKWRFGGVCYDTCYFC